MTIDDVIPARVGRDNIIAISGARPGSVVRLIAGRPGSVQIGVCPGLETLVTRLWVSDAYVADSGGLIEARVRIPTSLAGTVAGFQALEVDGCTLSEPEWVNWPTQWELDDQAANGTLYGTAQGEGLGYAVGAAGDVNADGLADIVVGAPGASVGAPDSGAAYLLYGPLDEEGLILNRFDAKLGGSGERRGAGVHVDALGDVNGDGASDVLVSEQPLSQYDGRVYVVSGVATGERLLSDAALATLTHSTGVYVLDVKGAGDVNGDGHVDVLIQASVADPKLGDTAFLVHGPLGGDMDLADAQEQISFAGTDITVWYADGGGDYNGDGLADVLLGARYPYVYPAGPDALVYFGPATGASYPGADVELSGDISGTYDVSKAGDVDGDGLEDLLVVGSGNEDPAMLVLGPPSASNGLHTPGATFWSEARDHKIGQVSNAGDLNGDGYGDLVFGTLYSFGYQEANLAHVVMGPVRGSMSLGNADLRIEGSKPDDRLGWAVSGAGDTNGDGLDDVVIGAHNTTYQTVSGRGAIHLFQGASGL